MTKKKVCVVGVGVMGNGLAQICAQAGYDTAVVSRNEESLERGLKNIQGGLSIFVKRGRLQQEDADSILDALRGGATTSLGEGADGADFVIEAVYEDLELKKQIFGDLDRICPEHTILASNTSTFPIIALATVTKRPDKVIGTHFMNPPPLVHGVEIIQSLMTSEETVQRTDEFVRSLGKEPIMVKDSPGFVVSRMICLVMNEAVRMHEEGVASVEDIDKIARLCFNWPMGPFRLLDLIGIDIVAAVLNAMYTETGSERFKPALLMTQMVRAGWTGRKAGKGFYDY
ncbi:MAG TPA: 3-hydroxyacyl-CoA dehydrogenase family protein [Desulfobacteria bacterium]|nr:3-hydroxyacyl-CoA dehydrogenase family protein [Desulfobacteria bacterium]